MSNIELQNLIEAILFFRGEPTTLDWIAQHINEDKESIEEALTKLDEALSTRGIRLVRVGNTIELGTTPEAGAYIEKLVKDELSHNLGKAGLETLSIILYKGPISRSGIEQIRGVNSQYVLRNLLIRGLIERIGNETGLRSLLYSPTTALYQLLGITSERELPDRDNILEQIAIIEQSNLANDNAKEDI